MPSKTKVVEMVHYDEKLIYTDPTYRFKYLAEFCDFGKADVDALHQAAPVVDPLVPAIVDAVYEKLLHFDTTKSVFLQRNDGYNGKMVTKLEDLKWDDPQLGFRKDFLAKYLRKLVTAEYDDRFIKYLDYVGKIHTAYSGKSSRINVDYVHCSALFAFVTSFVVKAVLGAGLPKDVESRTVLALNKLMWIQNDFFAKHYVRDGEQWTGLGKKETKSVEKTVLLSVTVGSLAVAAWSLFRNW